MSLNDVLYKHFRGLRNRSIPTDFQNIRFRLSDLAFSREEAAKNYRSDPVEYDKFLDVCERALLVLNEASLLEVAITYLSAHDYLNEKDACEKLTQLFFLSFANQDDPLSIAELGRSFLEHPKAFAGFLRYLLQHKITPEQILSTHLLHKYLAYHISLDHFLIKNLYGLLNSFQDSVPLVHLAQGIGCGLRGFELYALNGQVKDANTLKLVDFVEIPVRFTTHENNLKQLHVLYHEEFLIAALRQWNDQVSIGSWRTFITQLFNQPDIVIAQLPLVVNRLYEEPLLLEALSQILNEQSLSILMKNHVVGLLNLIPFCPELVAMMPEDDLPVYLQTLLKKSTSGVALFSSLFTFFQCIKNNTVFAPKVFDAMLEVIHMDPCVLDDTVMVGNLRKFEHTNAWINRKVRGMEADLSQIIQLHTQGSIANMNRISIEDFWQEIPQKIRHFKELVAFKTSFPMDIYMLYAQIARIFIQREKAEFNIYAFSLALGIEALFDEHRIKSYERLVLELLIRIDDEQVRKACILILDTNVNYLGRDWRKHAYDPQCLFRKAVLVGNLGFIQWMENNGIKSHYSCDSLATMAANKNHWPVVSHFHVQHKLTHSTVNTLFETVGSQKSLSAIPELWIGEYPLPDTALIVKHFNLAVTNNDINSLRCFILCPEKPHDNVIGTAFDNAIKRKFFSIARSMAEGFSKSIIQEFIDKTLEKAARWNHCNVLFFLSTLSCNRPGKKEIENALMIAIRANHLPAVKQLVNFSPEPLCINVFRKARTEAHDKNMTDIENYLTMACPDLNKQNVVFFEKKAKLQPASVAEEPTIRHTTSCNVMSSYTEHGFFQKSDGISPIPDSQLKLLRQTSKG